MADRFAVASGNWLNTAIWNGGTLPASDDDVYSNGFTVAVNGTVTVLSIRNTAATGITAGGGFTAVNGFTLTLTGAGVITGGSNCFTSSLTLGQSFTLVGDVTGSTVNASAGVNNASSGTLNIIGNCTGGSAAGSLGVNNNSSGTVNITGNCLAGSGGVNPGTGAGNVSTGTMNITGDCFGSPTSGFSAGATNTSTGTLNITGMCRGSSSTSGAGANNGSSGLLVHIGIVQATASAPGITGTNVGQVTILTGPLLSSDASFSNATASGVNPCTCARWFPADTALTTFEYRLRGQSLSGSPLIRPARSLYFAESFAAGVQGGYPSETNVRSGTIYGPSNTRTGTCAVPPAGSVSLGVPVDNTTGSAAITADNIRSAVGLNSANLDTQLSGLSTNQTTMLSNQSNMLTNLAAVPAAVWAVLTSTLTAAGSIGKLLADNVNATISSAAADSSGVTTLLSRLTSGRAAGLDNLDATVSSRLATSGYTTPPTASAIATAVNSALDRTGYSLTSGERQAIATAVEQSILNENDGQAVLNAIVGAIGNQNIDQIALVAAIRADLERTGGTLATRSTLTAAQVRTELTPELSNLDAAVSSRLATSGYTSPPSASTIAAAVWSNTTRTLTTAIDNATTIATAVWSNITRTITGGTVDTLVNAPTVPTASEIATATRQEMDNNSAKLANLNATVTSRMAAADYQAPPSPADNAVAVRANLAPELTRVANCATVETTGAQIASFEQ